MRSILSPSEQFRESVLLRVRGICACGRVIARDDVLYEKAGTVSLEHLSELSMLAGELAVCACKSKERRGHSFACYRLPGAGPYVVATSLLQKFSLCATTLSVREHLPAQKQCTGAVIPLTSMSELAAALQLGQPLSIRAAWAEAAGTLDASTPMRDFPCGAGLHCYATTDANVQGQLDLSVLQLPEGGGPSEWLPARVVQAMEHDDIMCLVRIDYDVVQAEIKAEAQQLNMKVRSTGQRGLRLQRENGACTLILNTEAILASAVGGGKSLRFQARSMLMSARRRLHAFDEAAGEIALALAPQCQLVRGECELVGTVNNREFSVDLGAYADANACSRAEMIAQWGRV
jgi:hypothetical protein